jgi:AraC-like DNA-binding protein
MVQRNDRELDGRGAQQGVAMQLKRAPVAVLRPYVRDLWFSDRRAPDACAKIENVLPTGDMHLVVRLSVEPVRLVDRGDANAAHSLGYCVVGGARSSWYCKEVMRRPARSIGVQLKPGAAEALFGMPASDLAERHVALEDLWGRLATSIRERLLEAGEPEPQLQELEAILSERLPVIRGLHPAVADALDQFAISCNIREAVRRSGYSHRHFVALFRRSVGLTPKVYTRILRLQRVLAYCSGCPGKNSRSPSWAEVALHAGYSDQAHFNREFREFSGVTPEYYRRAATTASHHVATGSMSP